MTSTHFICMLLKLTATFLIKHDYIIKRTKEINYIKLGFTLSKELIKYSVTVRLNFYATFLAQNIVRVTLKIIQT